MSEQLLLTPPQAAKALALGVRTLRDLTNKTKEIPVVKIGGAVRYDVADLRAYIELKKIRN
jgi:excisionase family DNA binding protein